MRTNLTITYSAQINHSLQVPKEKRERLRCPNSAEGFEKEVNFKAMLGDFAVKAGNF